MKRVGIIGAGKIGGSLVARLSAAGNFDPLGRDVHNEQLARFAEGYGVETTNSNREAADESDLLVVAVKPWDVGRVLDEISPAIKGDAKAVVSVAAGVPISAIEGRLPAGAAWSRIVPTSHGLTATTRMSAASAASRLEEVVLTP